MSKFKVSRKQVFYGPFHGRIIFGYGRLGTMALPADYPPDQWGVANPVEWWA